jgi:hypothetical protein
MTAPEQPTPEAPAPWCRDAWFTLSLYGDGQGTSLHRGWEAICDALVAAHYFQPDDDQRAEVMAKFTDWEIWENVGGHPWRWFSDYEDGSITVERVTDGEDPDRFAAQRAAEAVEQMRDRKDAAYTERNRVVTALARLFPSGTRRTDIPGWSEDWHGCVYIDLPTGQVSWHYHDSQAPLFADLPPYRGEWDGHTTELKYERLAASAATSPPGDARRDGQSKLAYDKERRTLVTVDPHPAPPPGDAGERAREIAAEIDVEHDETPQADCKVCQRVIPFITAALQSYGTVTASQAWRETLLECAQICDAAVSEMRRGSTTTAV